MGKSKETSSIWSLQRKDKRASSYYPKLESDIGCEVCVVGGGITGATLAFLLAQEGVDVVLIEAQKIASGTTGASTAHIDPLTDSFLYDLKDKFGLEKTRKILRSNLEAMELIESLAKKHAPACGHKKVRGMFLAKDQRQLEKLRKEQGVALELNLNPKLETNPKKPFPCAGRLVFDNHARFDPLEYTIQIAKAAKLAGARIYENTRAKRFSEGIVQTERGRIKAEHIVLATHTPAGLHPLVQSKVFPFRSYAVGVRVEDEIEDALYWDMDDPYHYIRKSGDESTQILIIGGSDHRTGELRGYPIDDLKAFASKHFKTDVYDCAWSSQYYKSADGMPYIGKLPGNQNIWVATGFEGNGITFGTVAAQLLKETIRDLENPYAEIYSPTRLKLGTYGLKLAKENFAAARDFIMDRLERPKRKVEDLKAGEGDIVDFNGEQLACYKEDNGDLYALSPVCPHAKCHVRWNRIERSWDCPCHGGRFSATGELLNGPPTHDLKKVDMFPARKEKNEAGEDEGPRAQGPGEAHASP